MLPFRNRTDSSPSWQHKIIWNTPFYKGQVACGANRIGKSQLGGFVTALMVTGEHPTYRTPKKGIAWIVGLDSKQIAMIQRPYFEQFIPKRYMDNGKWHGKNDVWYLTADGREWQVWFKSVDSGRQKFQGAKIDFCWIDEEPKKTEIFKEIEMRLIDNAGIWLMTATPVDGTRWLKEILERSDVHYTMAGMRDNPYLPLEEIEKAALQMTKDERMVRIEGKYLIFGGRPVFDRDLLADLEVSVCSGARGNLVTTK